MDYQRLVSYIYSYPEGVKGRNVGFAKALVHQGQFKLNISLRGVKTDSPEMFGIYMMVTDGGYRLIKLGECLVKVGQMEYSGVFNPDNINETGYGFKDICGLAVAREDARYDCMMSMWKDEDVTPDMLVFSAAKIPAETQHLQQKAHRANATQTDPFQKLFVRADYIDAFDDDYFYDCIEVSPEKLKCLNQNEIDIAGNSFLLHGYYNFRHILFGRVRDNLDNTKYFIGVPGMYCNRERYMASMFGFNNFKKSHRSDYANPYFGYWYQEI